MIIRFAVIGGLVALAVSAAGAHQKSNEAKLSVITAEQPLQNYRIPADETWTVLPDHRKSGRDVPGVELAHEGMGHCRHCHL